MPSMLLGLITQAYDGVSVIDFEIGAYSRPLTQAEKVKLGLT